jgi:23S rRNA-/tRNA-specific pseudouridylate synthase
MMEKAYKLLAVQEGITNRSAKDLIDNGLVYSSGKKVVMARAPMPGNTTFRVEKPLKIKKIYEDDKIVVMDKPAFITSEQIARKEGVPLLHRLDKETSGLLILVKDEDFQKKAIEAFRKHEVDKSYIAWVQGVIAEEMMIDAPLLTIKKGGSAYSKVSKNGKEAISIIEPLEVHGKRSKVKVTIKTGRTHQIRAHLKHAGYPIIGDRSYGGRNHKRMLLHAYHINLLGYDFTADTPKDFWIN